MRLWRDLRRTLHFGYLPIAGDGHASLVGLRRLQRGHGTLSNHEHRIELVMPASPQYVLLARLTVAGIASRMGMSYDDVEDVRVLAAEACRLLIGEEGADGTLTVTYTVDDEYLEIRAECETAPPPPGEDDLAVHLISVLADDHDVDLGNGRAHVRIRKRVEPSR